MAVTPLTQEQITRLRRKIGDVNSPPAFPDADLEDTWQEVGGSWNMLVLESIDELISNSWRFTDYVQNQSQEKKSQILSNLLKVRAIWQKKVDDDAVATANKNQVKMTGLRPVPPRRKERPDA